MNSLRTTNPTHEARTKQSRSVPLRMGALIAWAVGLLAILLALAPQLEAQESVKKDGNRFSRQGNTDGPPATSARLQADQIPIADGSFEGGTPNPDWDESSTNWGSPLGQWTVGGETAARTGTWVAVLGLNDEELEESSLSQDVLIDTGASDLTFWLWVPSCENGDDYLEVLVDGTQEYVVDGTSPLCGGANYTDITLDLSAYADGGTYTLTFEAQAASDGNSTGFVVDDVGVAPVSPDPTLDEPCALADFDIDSPANGGSPVVLTCEAGVATEGNVVGFHFIGTAAGISDSESFASDTCMIVEAPDGTSYYGVGGFDGTDPACNVNRWDFDGSGSSEDGTYESTHDGSFPEVDDEGTWTFTFINDWNDTNAATILWSDVVVTLRKVPSIATEASPDEIAEILGTPSPNPVRGAATFAVAVEQGQNVLVEVFDMTGRRVQTLYDAPLAAGMAEMLELDASALPAGVYVIRATGEGFVKTRRVTVVR